MNYPLYCPKRKQEHLIDAIIFFLYQKAKAFSVKSVLNATIIFCHEGNNICFKIAYYITTRYIVLLL